MVAHRILVPFVRVRVFPRQHKKETSSKDASFFYAELSGLGSEQPHRPLAGDTQSSTTQMDY